MISLEEVKKLIEAELRPFKAKITEYEGKIAELEYSQNFLSSKYDSLLKQIQGINSKNNKVEKDVIDLRRDLDHADAEIDDLEQYLRRDCVEISGIDPDMLREEQCCEDVVRSLGTEMGVEIEYEDISTVHPLPTFNEKKDKKMIVKFTRRDVRNHFYGQRKAVAGKKISSLSSLDISSDKKLYISESLTAFRKKLFGAANKMRKDLKWNYIWTQNGQIYLKQKDKSTPVTIKSAQDLMKFAEKHKQPQPTNLSRRSRGKS